MDKTHREGTPPEAHQVRLVASLSLRQAGLSVLKPLLQLLDTLDQQGDQVLVFNVHRRMLLAGLPSHALRAILAGPGVYCPGSPLDGLLSHEAEVLAPGVGTV